VVKSFIIVVIKIMNTWPWVLNIQRGKMDHRVPDGSGGRWFFALWVRWRENDLQTPIMTHPWVRQRSMFVIIAVGPHVWPTTLGENKPIICHVRVRMSNWISVDFSNDLPLYATQRSGAASFFMRLWCNVNIAFEFHTLFTQFTVENASWIIQENAHGENRYNSKFVW
jgi:hypothetical protein